MNRLNRFVFSQSRLNPIKCSVRQVSEFNDIFKATKINVYIFLNINNRSNDWIVCVVASNEPREN